MYADTRTDVCTDLRDARQCLIATALSAPNLVPSARSKAPESLIPARSKAPEPLIPARSKAPETVIPARSKAPEPLVPARSKAPGRYGTLGAEPCAECRWPYIHRTFH